MKYEVHGDWQQGKTAKFRTLAEARAYIRRHNSGRLYGKFVFVPDKEARIVEGWNLGKAEGCDTAVITQTEELCKNDN